MNIPLAQIPVVTTKVSERGAALNHVRWSADGHRLLVGDLEGRTYVYEVGEVGLECVTGFFLFPLFPHSFKLYVCGLSMLYVRPPGEECI